MSSPSPAERVLARLEHLPDACRALLTALDRTALAGGGHVSVTLQVDEDGRVRAVEVPTRYERRG